MITKTELNKEIERTRAEKDSGVFYDEYDREACFGYYHALMFVKGILKPRTINSK